MAWPEGLARFEDQWQTSRDDGGMNDIVEPADMLTNGEGCVEKILAEVKAFDGVSAPDRVRAGECRLSGGQVLGELIRGEESSRVENDADRCV